MDVKESKVIPLNLNLNANYHGMKKFASKVSTKEPVSPWTDHHKMSLPVQY
jgi:hypothetical protein